MRNMKHIKTVVPARLTGCAALLRCCLSAGALLVLPAAAVQAQQWVDTTQHAPEALFAEKCGMCHRQQGMGTTLLQRRYEGEQALLESRRDLQPAFIRSVVRSGFGNMFPLSRAEVSEAQLERIITHLTGDKP